MRRDSGRQPPVCQDPLCREAARVVRRNISFQWKEWNTSQQDLGSVASTHCSVCRASFHGGSHGGFRREGTRWMVMSKHAVSNNREPKLISEVLHSFIHLCIAHDDPSRRASHLNTPSKRRLVYSKPIIFAPRTLRFLALEFRNFLDSRRSKSV